MDAFRVGEGSQELGRVAVAVLAGLAAGKLLIHFGTNGNYGYFRDELYYIACSDHLAWGYVDQPPLSIAFLAATRALLGDSIFAIRLPVVLSGAVCVVLTGLLARALGGRRYAQGLAALAYLTTANTLAMSSFFSMNAFDLLFWRQGRCFRFRAPEQNRRSLAVERLRDDTEDPRWAGPRLG